MYKIGMYLSTISLSGSTQNIFSSSLSCWWLNQDFVHARQALSHWDKPLALSYFFKFFYLTYSTLASKLCQPLIDLHKSFTSIDSFLIHKRKQGNTHYSSFHNVIAIVSELVEIDNGIELHIFGFYVFSGF